MFMDISALFAFIEPKSRGPPTPFNFSNLKLNGGNQMENIKTFEVDGNKLLADFENNKYFIIFKNYEGQEVKSEIPIDIFNTYLESKKAYIKNKNEESRHWEHIMLSENEMYTRAFELGNTVEEIIIKKMNKDILHKARKELSETQIRRIDLHIVNEITIRDLAKLEQVNKNQIEKSLKLGIKKIKKFFE